MSKPKPKRKIAVQKRGANLLFIGAAAPDVAAWVEKNAPEFGELRKFEGGMEYHLDVSLLYDLDEVAAWIESQG